MQVALIQFKDAGKKYYFSVENNLELELNDVVVVETAVGIETGKVYSLKEEDELEITQALKPILRVANEHDLIKKSENEQLERDVVKKTILLVRELDLGMKILESEFTLDRAKLTIYFESENRVDFRELVKRISSIYQTRIELRQIGPRDVAKRVGGIGPCGLVLCCSTFIGEFEPVTIKMAKNQNLALNPKKISGVCGKLLCCLKYEDDVYTELRDLMPDINNRVKTEKGKAVVIDINFLTSKIKVRYLEDKELSDEWIDYRESTLIQWNILLKQSGFL
ncbi:PSP1 C-terminal conserved region [Haploplasma axanthum]|uniref:PSP1 C-terminal conserved region n=2 Tax=Haploplasma axanthum TaxID=29552 RepID=A0A449BCI7_HAPAX|nr:PSP1 C-terminal conserved region [Haploplasma axanthum]